MNPLICKLAILRIYFKGGEQNLKLIKWDPDFAFI